ncbi:MAG TPA: CocE/NonD family hydrolase [Solirubrobacterales bacterium]|nr:CocE/NonD family hydrolase [Solirubrobacterales bacterium]
MGTGTSAHVSLRLALGASVPALALFGLFAAPASAGTDPGYEARGSVEQVYATGLEPGQLVDLIDEGGETIETNKATAEGGVLFRRVDPGPGYTVKPQGGEESDELTVLTDESAPPDESVYDQEIEPDGYQYLETRDGTKLAISVHPPSDTTSVIPGLPLPDVPEGAPTPTLIEYSGYGTADPDGPESGISIIGNLMGFTVVDVNMRGTGCSGGAFDFFEPLQGLDGYDVIETISRQPWVKGGKVGMMGISYGGISQLFTGQYNPPSLAALTPISVLDGVQTTLYPGGILNTGFALEWAKDRIHDALPSGPDTGQPWAWEQIQSGDTVCAENQAMHGEARNLLKKIHANRTYRPRVADPLSPITFADKIEAPTFLACQWEDEQTGGHCPTLAAKLSGNERAWSTFTNGTHVDSLSPEVLNKWFDFLKLYVAEEPPALWSPVVQAGAPIVYQVAFGINGVTMPPDPIQQEPTYEGALAAFEAQDPVRILFDNGAGGAPGKPYPGFEQSFGEFPPADTERQTWYLDEGGVLADKAPKTPGSDSFVWDDDSRPPTNFTGDTGAGADGLWTDTPAYEWSQPAEGHALSYVTDPLAQDTTVLGSGYVKVWIRSESRNADLQATISEVRPDGKETFVQGGWLRANMRKLDKEKSTPLAPVLSLRKADIKPLRDDRFVKATIPLYYQGHAYRAGSQIRVTISDVGGDQPIWAFKRARPKGTPEIDVAFGKSKRSKLTLPVTPSVEVPTELPPCPGLRGEPCRDYVPFDNAG